MADDKNMNTGQQTGQASGGQTASGNVQVFGKAAVDENVRDNAIIDLIADFAANYGQVIKNSKPEEIASNLILYVRNGLKAVNSKKTEKVDRFSLPTKMEPFMVARIVAVRYHVVNIIVAKCDDDDSSRLLGIYQESGPDEGIYVTADSELRTVFRSFCPTLTIKQCDETKSLLSNLVESKFRTRDRNLIAVNNGIYHYDTDVLSPFTPDCIFISKVRTDYNPNVKLPVIHNDEDGTDWDPESWMNSLSDDPEIVNVLWEIIGAIVRPNVPWGKMAWFYAESGNNGKGTLCELMRNLVGEGAYAAISLAEMDKDFSLQPLFHACAIIVDENDVGTYIDKAANLKALVTNDAVQVNRKFKQPIAYKFYGFIVQCLNEMPRIKDKSDSFFRRQLFIPFTKCFTGKERKYIKYDYMNRPEVKEYFLWRVLTKMKKYYKLSEPKSCQIAQNEYREFNDPVRQFKSEMLPLLQWDLVPWAFLYQLFCAWYAENISKSEKSCPSKTKFIETMSQLLTNDPEWYGDKDTQYKTGSRMSKPELLIREYDLKKWYNHDYNGKSNINRLCMPSNLAGSYRGIIRRSASQNVPPAAPPAGNNEE